MAIVNNAAFNMLLFNIKSTCTLSKVLSTLMFTDANILVLFYLF